MAVQPKNVLKEYFVTGDKPTQQQFENLIDSFSHIDAANPQKNWVTQSETDVISASASRVLPWDYVIDNGTLVIESENSPYTVAGTTFVKRGVLQVARNMLIRNGILGGDGLVLVGGFIVVEGDINISGNIETGQFAIGDLPNVTTGETIIFTDVDDGVIKKKDENGISNY